MMTLKSLQSDASTCPAERANHITWSYMILGKSPRYSVTRKQNSIFKDIFPRFPFRSDCVSLEHLYVKALWPLSHHRHDHRNSQPFVYRRGPVYGLMVILVVCLWHEPDSQLFDTEAAETDGNQMPFLLPAFATCVSRSHHECCRRHTLKLSLSFDL